MKTSIRFHILLLQSVVFLLISGQASALTISLDVSDADILVGETFTIEVWANNVFNGLESGEEVLAFGFDVTNSDPLVAGYEGYTVGSSFYDDSAIITGTDVAGSAFPGVTDASILLAALDFSALRAGDVTLGISSDLFDPNKGLVYLLTSKADITSSIGIRISDTDTYPVPEPYTLLLFGMGLIGLLTVRSSKKENG